MQTTKEKIHRRWRVRLLGVVYLALLFTLSTPVVPLHSPNLEVVRAQIMEDPRELARYMAKENYGWENEQFTCLNRLWGKESAWNHLADNPTSSAFGIAQMLGEDSVIPKVQIRNGLRYILHRYGNPCEAWSFWQRNNWY